MWRCLTLLALVGCSSVGPIEEAVAPDFGQFIEATLSFSVEGQHYVGTASVKRKSSLRVSVSLPDQTKIFTYSTLHGDVYAQNPGRDYSFYFTPVMYLENVGNNLIFMKAITDKGKQHYGAINLITDEEIPVRMFCNRTRTEERAASICQAKEGKKQLLWFKSPVKGYASPECPPLEAADRVEYGWRYYYNIAPGFCAYTFVDRQGKKHRHTSYGFTEFVYEQELKW